MNTYKIYIDGLKYVVVATNEYLAVIEAITIHLRENSMNPTPTTKEPLEIRCAMTMKGN